MIGVRWGTGETDLRDSPTKNEQMTPKTSTRSTMMVIMKGFATPIEVKKTVVYEKMN